MRRRVLAGFLLVAGLLAVTDVGLAATFRSVLLGRVDDQIAQAAEAVLAGPAP